MIVAKPVMRVLPPQKASVAGLGKLILGARAPPARIACAAVQDVFNLQLFALRAQCGRGRPRSQYKQARLRSDRLFGQVKSCQENRNKRPVEERMV
jgi:hypothetical protein